jgi:hypothetical protein
MVTLYYFLTQKKLKILLNPQHSVIMETDIATISTNRGNRYDSMFGTFPNVSWVIAQEKVYESVNWPPVSIGTAPGTRQSHSLIV